MRENIQLYTASLRRLEGEGKIGTYVHHNGKVGVAMGVTASADVAGKPEFDALLKDRAKLPIGFKPDKKKDFAVATKPKKGESAVEAAMKLLGDEKGVEKIKEAAAKVEKQRLKMEADRKRYEALEDQIQREYNAKMAAVNARAAAVKDEMARKEQQRLDDQIAKGKAQAKAAEKFEVDERKHALQKLEEEMAELEVQRKAALREKRKEMPDPCATWDNNGGDLGNGTWPAARINAADKQYTLEAVQAP